jgi:hypothetical protein
MTGLLRCAQQLVDEAVAPASAITDASEPDPKIFIAVVQSCGPERLCLGGVPE